MLRPQNKCIFLVIAFTTVCLGACPNEENFKIRYPELSVAETRVQIDSITTESPVKEVEAAPSCDCSKKQVSEQPATKTPDELASSQSSPSIETKTPEEKKAHDVIITDNNTGKRFRVLTVTIPIEDEPVADEKITREVEEEKPVEKEDNQTNVEQPNEEEVSKEEEQKQEEAQKVEKSSKKVKGEKNKKTSKQAKEEKRSKRETKGKNKKSKKSEKKSEKKSKKNKK